tara:strand:+ start:704 stop:1357 length:654 start_codon:yes stop_codon:yes gene_type:complete
MKNFIAIIFLAFLAISCTKDNPYNRMDHTEVKGRLLDASTGEPIEGGTIYLTDGGSWIVVDSLVTTATGEYSFKYDHEEYGYAEFWAKAPNYLSNKNIGTWAADYPNGGASGRGAVRDNGRVNYEDIRLPPVGYVKYCFTKTSTGSGNYKVNLLPYSESTLFPVAGGALEDCFTFYYPGGVDYRIVYAIFKDGTLVEGVEDTAYVPRFDTLTYNIEF